MRHGSQQGVLFEQVFPKPVVVEFDGPSQSSDGGALLLGAIDRDLGLTELLAGELQDGRDPGKIDHPLLQIMRQRVFSIALGYPDCNDSARIGSDPLIKLLCGRGPQDDSVLASQPTLSRFENAPTGRELVAMGRALEVAVIEHLKQSHPRARLITIDLDPTDDPTHGQQPFTFFNGHYDSWCYLPLLGFLSIDDLPEQHLFYARLRPGTAKEVRCTAPLLRRTVARLRRRFPKARIRVRLDGGFVYPRLLALLDELKVEYVLGIPENKVLTREAHLHMETARRMAARKQESVRLYWECRYQSRSWERERRVVIKAEVVCLAGRKPRDNARFVVTNLRHSRERVFDIYRQRGDSENRIKELHHDLEFDRTSCSRFLPNQFRVLQTAAAYVLYQELRRRLRHTELERAQVGTLRLKLMKISALVVESVRRVLITFPDCYPWKDLWRAAARSVGAAAG